MKGISLQERGEKGVSSVQNTFPNQNEHLIFIPSCREEGRHRNLQLGNGWVQGEFQIICSSGFGGAASRISVILSGRCKRLTDKLMGLLCHHKTMNYWVWITKLSSHRYMYIGQEQRSPNQESILFDLFQKVGPFLKNISILNDTGPTRDSVRIFVRVSSPWEWVVSRWAPPRSDVSGWFFCSEGSWFEPQGPGRVAQVRIMVWWKAERCLRI